jgi:hypothetical protein
MTVVVVFRVAVFMQAVSKQVSLKIAEHLALALGAATIVTRVDIMSS